MIGKIALIMLVEARAVDAAPQCGAPNVMRRLKLIDGS